MGFVLIQRGFNQGWRGAVFVADIFHQKRIFRGGDWARDGGARLMQCLKRRKFIHQPGRMLYLFSESGLLAQRFHQTRIRVLDRFPFRGQHGSTRTVLGIVAEISDDTRAIDLSGDELRLHDLLYVPRGATTIDTGFLAAFDRCQHIRDHSLLIKITEGRKEPHFFVTGRFIGSDEITQTIAVGEQAFENFLRTGIVTAPLMAHLKSELSLFL